MTSNNLPRLKITKVSRYELSALIEEVNNGDFGVRISYPLPDPKIIVFIVYKNNTFHETKRFGYLKPAKEFLVSILNGEYPN